jgi:hypothetical protein
MVEWYIYFGYIIIHLPISSKKLEFLFGLEGTELLMRPVPSSSRRPGADDVRNAFFTFVHLEERRWTGGEVPALADAGRGSGICGTRHRWHNRAEFFFVWFRLSEDGQISVVLKKRRAENVQRAIIINSIFSSHEFEKKRPCLIIRSWVRGSVGGWGTVLQAVRSRFPFSMISLNFSILRAALWPWGRLSF